MAIVTNQPQVIRVTVPGPQGPSAGAAAAAGIFMLLNLQESTT